MKGTVNRWPEMQSLASYNSAYLKDPRNWPTFNPGMDIAGQDRDALYTMGKDGRYVISLINIKQVHDLVLHHRTGDVLVFHYCDTKFTRFVSVRYPRDGKPTIITDTAFADEDFQKQLAFWFERMPGR